MPRRWRCEEGRELIGGSEARWQWRLLNGSGNATEDGADFAARTWFLREQKAR